MTLEQAAPSAWPRRYHRNRGGGVSTLNRGRLRENADSVTDVQKRSKDVSGILCHGLVEYAPAHDCAPGRPGSGVTQAEARWFDHCERIIIARRTSS